jgi:hypothetical protein
MNRDIIVFDFETGGRNPHKCQPTQIAAIALDGRNFRLKGQFNSLMRPIIDDEKAIKAGVDPIEEGALKVTGQTRAQLAKAPLPKGVWKKFCTFVNKYNWKGTSYFAPIPCGFNILGYDMHIVNRLCKEYGPYDDKRQCQKLFHQIYISLLVWIACEKEWDCPVQTLTMLSKTLRIQQTSGSNCKNPEEQSTEI